TTETSTLVRGGACQLRPRRPRPSVCSSATATAPSGSSGRRSRCVDGVTSAYRYGRPNRPPSSGSTTSGARESGTALIGGLGDMHAVPSDRAARPDAASSVASIALALAAPCVLASDPAAHPDVAPHPTRA